MQVFANRIGTTPLPLSYYLDEPTTDPLQCRIDGLDVFAACSAGSFAHLTAFLLGGVSPNAVRASDGTPLIHIAAQGGQDMLVRLLVDNGADVNATDRDGRTALMVACEASPHHHLEVVMMLLECGARLDARCRYNHSVLYYGRNHPLALNVLVQYYAQYQPNYDNNDNNNNININNNNNNCPNGPLPDPQEEHLLHEVCASRDSRFSALFFIENMHVPVDTPHPRTGDTPLHYAVQTADIDLVKALLSCGADPTLPNSAGRTALSLSRTRSITRLMKKYKETSSATMRSRLTLPDFSNYRNLDKKQFIDFIVPFIGPNLILIGSSFLPGILSLLCCLSMMALFSVAGMYSLSQKRRCFATVGWFLGGFISTITIVLVTTYPAYVLVYPENKMLFTLIPTCIAIVVVYFFAVMSDPGCVQSTPDARKDIYNSWKRLSERERYDLTAMVRRPLRSKHCTFTHQCVKRFDHYCVWTANAIGGGNHRPFFLWCWTTMIGTMQVLYLVGHYYVAIGLFELSFDTRILYFFFGDRDYIITVYGLLYTFFVFLFAVAMSVGQTKNMLFNMTSNEAWFPYRYSWMISLGDRVYNSFDKGIWGNIKEFCVGNLLEEHYKPPKMSEYIKYKVRAYANHFEKAQEMDADISQWMANATNNNNNNLVNTIVDGGVPMPGSPTTAPPQQRGCESCSTHNNNNINNINNTAATVAGASNTVTEVLSSLSPERLREMAVVQQLFVQLLSASNAGAPTDGIALQWPEDVLHDRRPSLEAQAWNMYRMYKERRTAMEAQHTPKDSAV